MASAKRNRQRTHRLIQESATVLEQVRGDLVALDEANLRSDGTVPIRLISPGVGSFGYYSPDVLEAAGTDRIFPRGTQMYWDHPSATERQDRPERSLRDLAAVFETDAVWRDDPQSGPGLYAQAKIFEAFKPLLAEMAPHIGVSIRAAAKMSTGQVGGKRTPIVERLVEGQSVDFVTKAGRGGAVLAVLEAAGRTDLIDEVETVGDWIRRTAVAAGVDPALEAFTEAVEGLAPELLTRDLWAEPAATNTTESQEDQMDDKQITEAVAEAVKAAVPAAIAEALAKANEPQTTDVDEAAKELTEAKARADRAEGALLVEAAKRHVAANTKVQGLPAVARGRLIEAVANEAKPGTDGTLDIAKLDEATTAAVDAEVKYLAEATGNPVRGVGGTDTTHEATEAVNTRLANTFGRLGMSEDAAKVAVAGRR